MSDWLQDTQNSYDESTNACSELRHLAYCLEAVGLHDAADTIYNTTRKIMGANIKARQAIRKHVDDEYRLACNSSALLLSAALAGVKMEQENES